MLLFCYGFSTVGAITLGKTISFILVT